MLGDRAVPEARRSSLQYRTPGLTQSKFLRGPLFMQRVPRSQISRAHPPHNAGYGERTSAVLSALSGDDETALSAAEAAGALPPSCPTCASLFCALSVRA